MNKVKGCIEGCHGYHLLLVITCDQTNFTIVVPLRDRQTQMIAEALIYRVIYLFGPPRQIVCDEAAEFTSAIIQAILTILNCRLKVISPYYHGSSKCERQIKTISNIIVKHLWDKGQMWPLFATTAAYEMNTYIRIRSIKQFFTFPISPLTRSTRSHKSLISEDRYHTS